MAAQNRTGIDRLSAAALNSLVGIRSTWRHEEAFRQEVIIFLLAVPISFWLGSDRVERALLIGSVALILIVELINSAVEATVDRIGLEHHELSGRAKDAVSAAVLLTILLAGVIWLSVLL